MKVFLIIPILVCLQDSVRTDTVKVQKPIELFFEQKTVEQRAEDIDMKLTLLLKKLEAKNDSTNLK